MVWDAGCKVQGAGFNKMQGARCCRRVQGAGCGI